MLNKHQYALAAKYMNSARKAALRLQPKVIIIKLKKDRFFLSSLFKYFTAVILQITVNVQNSRIQKLNNLLQTKMKSNAKHQFNTILN